MIDNVQGMAFPFQIDPETGSVVTTRGQEKIRQNLRILLATRLSERPLVRTYGSRLPGLVQDPNDDVLAELARNQTQEAILQWEPRVLLSEVQTQQDADELTLFLEYIFLDNSATDQLLLPIR